MPLLPIWRKQPKDALSFTIQQILAMAGDGKLRDGSACSDELRTFLREVPSDFLIRASQFCLVNAFQDGGLVLQDIINEIGRRLEFDVTHGLYRGTKNKTGFDGLWKAPECRDVVIEVKTTDYINIPLTKLHDYKRSLVKDGKVDDDACFLIVLGREDAGSLEDQVRGSRHGWDTRLISVEGLTKLLQVKEKADQESTIRQIRALLQPIQTTKLDNIIEIVFLTATDVESSAQDEGGGAEADVERQTPYKQNRTPSEDIEAKRKQAIEAFGGIKKMQFVKHRRTLYRSADGGIRACTIVSKYYGRDYQPYWYAYHPHWDEFLREGRESFVILAGMNLNEAFAIPYRNFQPLTQKMNKTETDDRQYWHIALNQTPAGELTINLSSVGEKFSLEPYRYPFPKA